MPSSHPPSPRSPTSGVHPEPLPANLLPQEPIPRSFSPDITDTTAQGSQTPPPPARPPQFGPLFALISSSSSSSASSSKDSGSSSSPTHHHPTVHYIFADDHDSDLLITAAALQTLDPEPDPGLHPPSDSHSPSNHSARPRTGGHGEREKASGDGGGAAPPERFLIVDLDHTATRVVAARSMARDWQIVNADLTPAPTWEGDESNGGKTDEGQCGGGGGGRGLMLSVEGVGTSTAGGQEVGEGEVEEGLEKLAERYERRLGELRRVVEGVGARGGIKGEG